MLRRRIVALGHRHRVAFALSCCERLVPNFEAFAADQGLGRPTRVREILDGLWSLNGATYGDITYPHTFNREKNTTEVLCFYVIRGSGGKWAYTDQGKTLRCPS